MDGRKRAARITLHTPEAVDAEPAVSRPLEAEGFAFATGAATHPTDERICWHRVGPCGQANFLGLGVLLIGAAVGVSMYNKRNGGDSLEHAHAHG
jgi:hypothetical protein